MTIKPGIKGVLWMAPGAAIMLALILVVAHFQKAENTAEQLAFKARRVDLLSRSNWLSPRPRKRKRALSWLSPTGTRRSLPTRPAQPRPWWSGNGGNS